MGWLRDKIVDALESASVCDGCGHSDSAGVDGCDCGRSDCACGA